MKILLPDDDNIRWIQDDFKNDCLFFDTETKENTSVLFFRVNDFHDNSSSYEINAVKYKDEELLDYSIFQVSPKTIKSLIENTIKHFNKLDNESFSLTDMNEYIKDQVQQYQLKAETPEIIEKPDNWFDTFPNSSNLDYGLLQDMADFIIDECSKENYSFKETKEALISRYDSSEKGRNHLNAWIGSDKLKEFYDDLNTPTISTKNETSNINPKELEKMARVQGVCEVIVAIGDEANAFFGKKILTEMKVTQEDCKKYAKPETYKELEKTIFAPRQDQKFEQSQGMKR